MKNETNIKVPKKYEHMIDEVSNDIDGYWVYSKYGYRFPDADGHIAHEDSQKEILKQIRTLMPCRCAECRLVLEGK